MFFSLPSFPGSSKKNFKKDASKKKEKTSKQHTKPHRRSDLSVDGTLTLDISSHHVRLYSDPPSSISDDALAIEAMTPGNVSPNTPVIHLLSGPLTEFLQYSRQEASKWLLDIAHDICDPAYRRGSLVVQQGQHWLPVTNTDPLTPSVYRYDLPTEVTVGLAKISHRQGRSETSATGNAGTMANRVMQRDGRCWASRVFGPLINSHICPKRMGDHTARIIYRTYTNATPPSNLSIFDEVFGLNLSKTIDDLFDKYQLGFRYVAPVRSSYLLISKLLLINYLEPL